MIKFLIGLLTILGLLLVFCFTSMALMTPLPAATPFWIGALIGILLLVFSAMLSLMAKSRLP